VQRRAFLKTVASAPGLASSVAAQTTQGAARSAWNILVVVSDTLRTAYLGPYGNKKIQTPNLDRFAKEAAVFERAYPEALPTIPTRRTLHSGRRAFPFLNYKPTPWDNVYLAGWQPMSPDKDTVAEALDRAGYHCGFVSDVPHYFVPAQNFTRGFRQWDFVRGNAEDRYRSPAQYDQEKIQARYASARGPMHVANLGGFEPDEMDFATPRTFTSAMKFLEENQANSKPLYLYVDTFHPHESWEAPRKYYDLYRDPSYGGKTRLTVPYSTLYQNPIPEAGLQDLRAQYSGLVTMVDHWFGRLLDKLKETGKEDQTLVVFLSDHGTNFADNLEMVTGKPAGALYPGTMHIPLLIRHPKGKGAGKRLKQFVYTLDVPATVCGVAGIAPEDGLEGKSLLPLLEGGHFESREYLTCRYSNSVWYRDEKNWYFSNVHWDNVRLFDLESSNPFGETIARRATDRAKHAQRRILEDAGGELPKYPLKNTDNVKAPFI
jgi:arylsulfatase A-like enzyme